MKSGWLAIGFSLLLTQSVGCGGDDSSPGAGGSAAGGAGGVAGSAGASGAGGTTGGTGGTPQGGTGGTAGQAGTGGAGGAGGVSGGGGAAGAGGATLGTASSLTQYGITWNFETEVPYGQFANGDYWVVGPVTVIGIENEYHVHGFTPGPGQDGSMVNPDGGWNQGYDDTLNSYSEDLNAALPQGQPITQTNPLILESDASLISTVSWLYNSETDTEPGCPEFNAGTNTPRPVLRVAAVLTSLSDPAPAGELSSPLLR